MLLFIDSFSEIEDGFIQGILAKYKIIVLMKRKFP